MEEKFKEIENKNTTRITSSPLSNISNEEPIRIVARLQGVRRPDLSRVEIKILDKVKFLDEYGIVTTDFKQARIRRDEAVIYANEGDIISIYANAAFSGKYSMPGLIIARAKKNGGKIDVGLDYGVLTVENVEILRKYIGSEIADVADEIRSYWRTKGIRLSKRNDIDAIVTGLALNGELPIPVMIDETEKLREEIIKLIRTMNKNELYQLREIINRLISK